MKNLSKKTDRFYLFWAIFIFCLFLIFFGFFLKQQEKRLSEDIILKFDNIPTDINAISYFVGEINSGKVWIEKNSKLHFFPASLSKLMTAIIVLENFSLSEEINITPYAVAAEGEEGGLVVGEKIKVDDLLRILLISSSNDAAIAFEEALEQRDGGFVGLMNQKAREFKLFNSAFFDASGLDRKGNFTSAEDLFKLSQEIYKNYPYIGEITRKEQGIVYSVDKKIVHHIKNTNILTGQIYNLWGGKTGSTPQAKDCLLTVYEFPFSEKNGKIVTAIIVLNSSDRFEDTIKLYDWVREQITANK